LEGSVAWPGRAGFEVDGQAAGPSRFIRNLFLSHRRCFDNKADLREETRGLRSAYRLFAPDLDRLYSREEQGS